MDYANTTAGAALAGHYAGDAPNRPLESLALATQRVNGLTVLLGQFLDRFHGSAPADKAQGEIESRLPYNAEIARLFAALERLEQRVNSIGEIG